MKSKSRTLTALVLGAACLAPAVALLAADPEAGFTSLFNGTDLTGWDGSPDLWSVQDGAITGRTTAEHPAKGNTFLIWKGGDVADFELRCSFRLQPGDDAGFAN
ncbi:MAG: DUF1080 domain-containing protein, partial [Verrucomicrobia bacterium]|nr:DUF1080 domain-containing protein [Verrucomicrobiota bacterium]